MSDFTCLPRELLEEVAKRGLTRVYPKGTVVVSEGDPAETFYLIVEGTVKVFLADEEGREHELNELGAQQYFGELMLVGRTRSASVRTATPTKLCMIGREDFQRMLAERSDLAFIVIQNLIERVRSLTDSVRGLALMDVYGRVARLFLEMAIEEADGRRVIPTRLSQQKIAERVGASRSMINRILKDLTDGGYITVEQSAIVLHRALPKKW